MVELVVSWPANMKALKWSMVIRLNVASMVVLLVSFRYASRARSMTGLVFFFSVASLGREANRSSITLERNLFVLH